MLPISRFGRTEHPLCEMSRSYKPQIEISDLDQKKLQFLIKSPPNQQAVAKQLEVVYGNPIWPKKTKSTSLTVECTLTSETKDCQQLLGTWETNVKEKLNLFLDQLLVVKHTTLQEAYPLVLNKLMTLTIRNPDTVAVVLEKSSNELYVTGYRQAATDVSHQVGEIIHKITAENEFTQGEDVPDLAMSQHHIECQTETCGSYSEFYCNSCHQRMCGECRDQHLKHPDSSKHEVSRYEDRTLTVSSVPCKLHPRQQLTLCCKKCQQAICALCTTIEHDGHGFLNLEKVYTKNYKTRIEEIRRIRDDVLPKSRLRLKESKNATLEAKENVEMLKNSMKEQANGIKVLVDDILTKNLQDLQRYEASTVEKLENQEKVMDSYVNRLQTLLEEYKHSISSSNPTEFLPEMSNTPIVDLDPIPEVNKESPRNFSGGKLNKDEISRQFGKLT